MSKAAWLKAKVRPNHRGDCLHFRAEFYVAGDWNYPATTGCVVINDRRVAKAYLPGHKNYLGIPIRMRAEWRGDKMNLAEASPWRYVKFVR